MTTQYTITNAATSHNNLSVTNPANPSQVGIIAPGESRTFTAYGTSSLSITEGGSANTGPTIPPTNPSDGGTQAPAPQPGDLPAPVGDPSA